MMTKKKCAKFGNMSQKGGGVPIPKLKICFIMTPKRPNNPLNLCDNNNIMKVTPLICSPESQNND